MSPSFSRRTLIGTAALAAGVPLAASHKRTGEADADVMHADAGVTEVGLFTDIADAAIPRGATMIVTRGHRAPGIGAARYLLDPTSSDPKAVVRRFPLTATLTRDDRLFRLARGGLLSTLALGALGDGTTDDAPAIQQFLDSLETVASGGTAIPVTIDFHDLRYRLDRPLHVAQNLVCLHAQGAMLDGAGQAAGLIRVDHDNSINSPTGVAITGRWFLRGSMADAIVLESAPLFRIDTIHASGIAGDVVRVAGCVGGTVQVIEAYDCKGYAYRETGMKKRWRGGDEAGKPINCINNRVDDVRAVRCAGAWWGSESWHASIGRVDVESSTDIGVMVESCLAPSFQTIYEEDHLVAVAVRTNPRVFGSDFPVGDALIDILHTAGALVKGQRPCSLLVQDGAGASVRAGRVGGDIRITARAAGTRIGPDVDLLGRLEDAGTGTRVARHARTTVTVPAGQRAADVGFATAEYDDRYLPLVRVVGWTGNPSAGALTGRGIKPTRGGFRLELAAPVDPGCTVTFLAEAG